MMMIYKKNTLTLVGLFAFLAVLSGAPVADVTGTWRGTFDFQGSRIPVTFHLSAVGAAVAGVVVENKNQTAEIHDGKVDGQSVTFWTSKGSKVFYKGSISADAIKFAFGPEDGSAVKEVAVAKGDWPKPKPSSHQFDKWEKAVAAFEEGDKVNPPLKGAVLFVGSSTVVRWKSLATDFPDARVLNRGFGGSQIKDVTYYAERTIFPYEPSAIFLRGGGNDINEGWPVEEVFADFKAFVEKVRGKLPGVPIYYLGLSSTLKRIEQVPDGNRLNDLIANYCKDGQGLTYIDARKVPLDQNGGVRPGVFMSDMLHFNEEGYKLLADCVRPYVPKNK